MVFHREHPKSERPEALIYTRCSVSKTRSIPKCFIWECLTKTDYFNLASRGAKDVDNAASVKAVPVGIANFQANRESSRHFNL